MDGVPCGRLGRREKAKRGHLRGWRDRSFFTMAGAGHFPFPAPEMATGQPDNNVVSCSGEAVVPSRGLGKYHSAIQRYVILDAPRQQTISKLKLGFCQGKLQT